MIKLLIPSNCSDIALSAMQTAILMGERMRAKLYFIYAMDKPVVPAMASAELRSELYHEYKAKHKDELESLVRNLYANLKVRVNEAPYECIIADKPLELAIVNHSSELGIDLVVMGTSGASGFHKLFEGSNTFSIIQKSKLPVLVIPSDFKFSGFKKIAFPVDIHEFKKKKSFSILNQISHSYQSSFDCFYILSSDNSHSEAENKLKEIVTELDLSANEVGIHIKESDATIEVLEQWLKESACDLVTMLPRKWTLIKALFSKSMTKEMTHRANFPLLILS